MLKYEYAEKEILAKNMEQAYKVFNTIAYGEYYRKYVDENKDRYQELKPKEVKEIVNEEDYIRTVERLGNEDIFTTEVWGNGEGTFKGLASVI